MSDFVLELAQATPELNLLLDRPLYSPPLKPRITNQILLEGEPDSDADALFNQTFIDKARLLAALRQSLRQRASVSLGDLLQEHPLEQGLAELVAWLDLATGHPRSSFDEAAVQLITWLDSQGRQRRASIPLVVFSQ